MSSQSKHKIMTYKKPSKREKNIKALMLYDSNGIKVDEKANERMKLFSSIELKDLLNSKYRIIKQLNYYKKEE